MIKNMTDEQWNALRVMFENDIEYAIDVMKEIHEDTKQFDFVDVKALDYIIDGMTKDELYQGMLYVDTSTWNKGRNKYYVYCGTIYHYEEDKYNEFIKMHIIVSLLPSIDYNWDLFKDRPRFKAAMEGLGQYKLLIAEDKLKELTEKLDYENESHDRNVKAYEEKIEDVKRTIKSLSSELSI